jgi:hypothetical protein
MWLKTSCQHEEFRLSNNEFTIALCLRYGLKIPIIHETEKCPICKKKITKGPNRGTFCGVDSFGHHFISGCRKDVKNNGFGQMSQPHAIHDQMRRSLYKITQHAMVKSVQEPKLLLYQPDAEKQVRLDLKSVIPVNMVDVKFGVDVSMVGPFSGSRIGKPFVKHNVAADAAIPKGLEEKKPPTVQLRKLKSTMNYVESVKLPSFHSL